MSLKQFIFEVKKYNWETQQNLKDAKRWETDIFKELNSISHKEFLNYEYYKEFYTYLHFFFKSICYVRMELKVKSPFYDNVGTNLDNTEISQTNYFELGKILEKSYSSRSVFKQQYKNKIESINEWFTTDYPPSEIYDLGMEMWWNSVNDLSNTSKELYMEL